MDTSVKGYWKFQFESFGWLLLGIPVLLVLAYLGLWVKRFSKLEDFKYRSIYAWTPPWAWRWNNEEDGVIPPALVNGVPYMTTSAPWWRAYVWSAFRNSVAGLKAEWATHILQPVTVEHHSFYSITRSGPYWCVYVMTWFRFGWLVNVRAQPGDRTTPVLENLKGVEIP